MNQMDIDQTAEDIRQYFEQVNNARNLAYSRSRSLISLCARSIRAIHRDAPHLLTAKMGERLSDLEKWEAEEMR